MKLLSFLIVFQETTMLENDSNILGELARNCKDGREKISISALLTRK